MDKNTAEVENCDYTYNAYSSVVQQRWIWKELDVNQLRLQQRAILFKIRAAAFVQNINTSSQTFSFTFVSQSYFCFTTASNSDQTYPLR